MSVLFLKKKSIIKNLSLMLKITGGRDLCGHISSYNRGGGHARRYRLLSNLKVCETSSYAIIRSFEYDPNRSVFLALICYRNGMLGYIIPTSNMKIGDIICFNKNFMLNLKQYNFIHNFNFLKNFEVGSFVCNIYDNSFISKYSKTSGSKSLILKKLTNNKLILKLPSNQLRLVSSNFSGFNGIVAFEDQKFIKLKKAGQSRNLGCKPRVRGVAKNPVDHPHGGGEGKTSGGRCSVSPWGILTKGYPTVRGKKRKFKLKSQLI